MSDAQFLWGPNATDQDVAIGVSEAQTPDFGFHQPYDARHLPSNEAPEKKSGCPTCAGDKEKEKEKEKDGKTDDAKDWKDWGYRPQCPANGPPVADGDGTSMSAPQQMTPSEAIEAYNKAAESNELTQEQLNKLGESLNQSMNQSREQLEQLDRWNEMDRQMREMETEMP